MTTYLIEDRRAEVSPWGRGNYKLGTGPGIYTYSKLPGKQQSCPGSTPSCEAACYAKRMVLDPFLLALMQRNTEAGAALPPLPNDAWLVRGHISGDFDSVEYIEVWAALAEAQPAVWFWFYTRSWRVSVMLPALEQLRALPNVQLWASVDSDSELPPDGWRRAWLGSDTRLGERRAFDGALAPTCPEQTGRVPSCDACGYCFKPLHGDVRFITH